MNSSTTLRAGVSGARKDVVLASADAALRQRLRESLTGLRWHVHEASGGAEALSLVEEQKAEALLMDDWLPDLEATEFAGQIAALYPQLEVLSMEAGPLTPVRSARRNELLHALREVKQPVRTDTAAWLAAPAEVPAERAAAWVDRSAAWDGRTAEMEPAAPAAWSSRMSDTAVATAVAVATVLTAEDCPAVVERALTGRLKVTPIAEMVGESAPMVELARLIRLVAPRRSTVLIEGETGTGKEVVAMALHRLSPRASRPMTVLNCAAIPETLLESELFGHARGAFTGAVQSRTGRIEAANGGTLFLDEIGEMPLAVQAKMLRFLECGELQRVGDNDVVRVDVRVIAATHQDLERRVVEGTFRLDLFHRLAVFPLEVPALRERMSDLPLLAEHVLDRMGKEGPRKRLTAEALDMLQGHDWPGNVRELGHVLERAVILAGDAAEIVTEHVRYRRKPRG
ncbi:MAG TPA: sigma-54 dependent transcriptional regulator [Acidobacteriaceae bacterium]|jgi:DNA-binding NtrC family response regulator|nr:sigma-54 dependent transcriptional regulator [Acidobacteriaceae bacterium]